MSRRLQPEERRRQLVGAAVEVFADRAEEDVRMEDLAASAGVTRNLLFHYFDGKAALHREAVIASIARLAARHDTSEKRPLAEKVPANLGRWLDAIESGDPALRLLRRAGRSDDAEVAALVRAAREALARAIALNHLRDPDPPASVVAALLGYIAFAERLNEAWLEERVLTRDDVERILAAALPPIVAAAAV
jgi:AcrR family transcriptional regulator